MEELEKTGSTPSYSYKNNKEDIKEARLRELGEKEREELVEEFGEQKNSRTKQKDGR